MEWYPCQNGLFSNLLIQLSATHKAQSKCDNIIAAYFEIKYSTTRLVIKFHVYSVKWRAIRKWKWSNVKLDKWTIFVLWQLILMNEKNHLDFNCLDFIWIVYRASTCKHLQCFDASLYLQMNERKPTWNCPVCDKPALYESLVIDGYVDYWYLCIQFVSLVIQLKKIHRLTFDGFVQFQLFPRGPSVITPSTRY